MLGHINRGGLTSLTERSSTGTIYRTSNQHCEEVVPRLRAAATYIAGIFFECKSEDRDFLTRQRIKPAAIAPHDKQIRVTAGRHSEHRLLHRTFWRSFYARSVFSANRSLRRPGSSTRPL